MARPYTLLAPDSSFNTSSDTRLSTNIMSAPYNDDLQELTPAEQEILRLRSLVENMNNAIQDLQTKSQVTPKTKVKPSEPKVNLPDTFKGTRSHVNAFVSQLEIYFLLRSSQFQSETDKVIFTASFLRDAAFHWFEPHLKHLTQLAEGQIMALPLGTVSTFAAFREAIKATFGDIDETATAERQLKGLRQTTSVSFYTTEFQRIVSHLQWDNQALTFIFYNGLKDNIKDELARDERPSTLQEMVEKSIKIDNRLFERRREKNTTHNSQPWSTTQRFSAPEPMDLSASMSSRPSTFNKPSNPAPQKGSRHQNSTRPVAKLSQEERTYRMENNLCLFCGQAGHKVRECKQARQRNSLSAVFLPNSTASNAKNVETQLN